MFENDYTIIGKHASFLKSLAKKNAQDETESGKKTAKADLANFYDIREDLINLLIKSGNLKGN